MRMLASQTTMIKMRAEMPDGICSAAGLRARQPNESGILLCAPRYTSCSNRIALLFAKIFPGFLSFPASGFAAIQNFR